MLCQTERVKHNAEIYEVKKIIGEKADPKNVGSVLYLVQWKNYDNQDTWEPEAHLKDHGQAKVDEWKQSQTVANQVEGTGKTQGRKRKRKN